MKSEDHAVSLFCSVLLIVLTAKETNGSCYCYLYSSKNKCCPSLSGGPDFCCTATQAKYSGYWCDSDADCGDGEKTICCQRRSVCCSNAEYEDENPLCASDTNCFSEDLPYCCGEGRCCTFHEHEAEKTTCYSDLDCGDPSRPHCCSDAKCCRRIDDTSDDTLSSDHYTEYNGYSNAGSSSSTPGTIVGVVIGVPLILLVVGLKMCRLYRRPATIRRQILVES